MRDHFSTQKFIVLTLAVVITISGFANTAQAAVVSGPTAANATAAPANDNFANAQEITGVSGDIPTTNAAATKETGEPIHAQNRGGSSIWFKYVATGNGVMNINLVNSNIDTLLAVYVGSDVNNLTLVAANDDLNLSSLSAIAGMVHFGTQTGTTYYIAVDGKRSGSNIATGNIRVAYTFSNVMTSDSFAQPIAVSASSWIIPQTTTNVGASKEVGEPNHTGNGGGRSVWFKLKNTAPFTRTLAFTIDSQKVSNPALPHNTLFSIYTGTDVGNLTQVAGGQFLGHSRFVVPLLPGTTYYVALDGFDGGSGAELGNFTLTTGVARSDKNSDFDRDGKADLTVFRPSTGVWYSIDSVSDLLRTMQFGVNGDKPMLGDYDRDGDVDYSVFRPDLGAWYMNKTSTGFQGISWGAATDIPLVRAVYSGGSTGYYQTVFRPSTGTWYTYRPAGNYAVQFGQNGDIPMFVDLTGDGVDDYCIFRASNSTWYTLDTVTDHFDVIPFGTTGDKPVPADYDADGKTDLAVFRPSEGNWYVIYSSDQSVHVMQWGQSGDRPQPADFDGDGKADFVVYRNGTWYMRYSTQTAYRVVQFGLATDIPVFSPVP